MKDLNTGVDIKNPWVTYNSDVIYENKWIKLRKDDVTTPQGNRGIYSYVDKLGAVGAVVLTNKNEVYLVGQYRYTMNEYTWEIIEGGVEQGETYLEAIKREIKEEAGLISNNFELLIEDVHISNCVTNERGSLYLVRGAIETGKQELDSTEKIVVKKVPFDEALTLVYEGKIKDAFSIIGILLASKKLGKN